MFLKDRCVTCSYFKLIIDVYIVLHSKQKFIIFQIELGDSIQPFSIKCGLHSEIKKKEMKREKKKFYVELVFLKIYGVTKHIVP